MQHERLKKLAHSIEALAEKDRLRIEQAETIAKLRHRGRLEIYRVCADFVTELNALLNGTQVTLDPPGYAPEEPGDRGMDLFQINVRGRILQLTVEPTPELLSTEDFRVPYTLEGAIRCFNQQMLEKDLVEEQLLYYCVEKRAGVWRFFDARTYRTGPFDADYLIGLLEQLV